MSNNQNSDSSYYNWSFGQQPYNSRAKAKERAQTYTTQSNDSDIQTNNTFSPSDSEAKNNLPKAYTDQINKVSSTNFSSSANADVQNQMQNNFYDNTFGAGASVGNNNSVNIISQGGDGLNNMQSVAAYKGLNNNDYERSYGRLNGYGRAAGAIEEADKSNKVVDRVANLYNMAGLTQKYWKNASYSHTADYLGDIWKEGGFEFQLPGQAKKAEDKTQEIADGMEFDD